MNKHYRMTREKFEEINQDQKDSGLTIVDYCHQNAISVRSFYTWRYKFSATVRNTDNDPRPPRMEFAPVNIKDGSGAGGHALSVMPESDGTYAGCDTEDSISIDLPGGVSIHFNGKAQSKAFGIITKLVSSHVLP